MVLIVEATTIGNDDTEVNNGTGAHENELTHHWKRTMTWTVAHLAGHTMNRYTSKCGSSYLPSLSLYVQPRYVPSRMASTDGQQPLKKTEEEIKAIVATVAENCDDIEIRRTFSDLILQL